MAALQLRPKYRTLHHPSLIRLFCTSRSPPDPTPSPTNESPASTSPDPDESQSKFDSSFASYLNNLKSSLKKEPEHGKRRPSSTYARRRPTNDPSLSRPSKVASVEEILPEFLSYLSVPPATESDTGSSTPSSQSSQHISLQDFLERKVIEKAEENCNTAESGPGKFGDDGGGLSFEAIRDTLRQDRRSADPVRLSEFKSILGLGSSTESDSVIGGTDPVPVSASGKESERKETDEDSTGMKTEFAKMYSPGELEEKLEELRSEGKKKGQAALSHGESKEQETASRIGGVSFEDLRESLSELRQTVEKKAKKNSSQ